MAELLLGILSLVLGYLTFDLSLGHSIHTKGLKECGLPDLEI